MNLNNERFADIMRVIDKIMADVIKNQQQHNQEESHLSDLNDLLSDNNIDLL
jgi:hypothetical protein